MKNDWTEQDAKYREALERVKNIIKENKLLRAEVKELRQDRDYWKGVAHTGGKG